jgi:hypothetical protein
MADNGRNGPLPAWEVYDHPVYGKVVRCNVHLNHPAEELSRHRGRYVAWSMDGTKVLASGDTFAQMCDEVNRLGIGEECILAHVPEDA